MGLHREHQRGGGEKLFCSALIVCQRSSCQSHCCSCPCSSVRLGSFTQFENLFHSWDDCNSFSCTVVVCVVYFLYVAQHKFMLEHWKKVSCSVLFTFMFYFSCFHLTTSSACDPTQLLEIDRQRRGREKCAASKHANHPTMTLANFKTLLKWTSLAWSLCSVCSSLVNFSLPPRFPLFFLFFSTGAHLFGQKIELWFSFLFI